MTDFDYEMTVLTRIRTVMAEYGVHSDELYAVCDELEHYVRVHE